MKRFVDALGRPEVADRAGVSVGAVDLAVHNGQMSARWYAGISELCRDRGVECPQEFFGFNKPKQSTKSKTPSAATSSSEVSA
ncbi:MAG: hypothetical protein AAFQ38_14995 [Pseudomonadota bacterium]